MVVITWDFLKVERSNRSILTFCFFWGRPGFHFGPQWPIALCQPWHGCILQLSILGLGLKYSLPFFQRLCPFFVNTSKLTFFRVISKARRYSVELLVKAQKQSSSESEVKKPFVGSAMQAMSCGVPGRYFIARHHSATTSRYLLPDLRYKESDLGLHKFFSS